MSSSSPSVERVATALREAGISSRIVELSESTRTADEAARAIGCTVGQIAKSLVFRTESGASVLVVASGTNRVDERKLAGFVGETVERAAPDFVREMSGYVIGGVPPTGHVHSPLMVLVDEDLQQYDEVWAAAGSPHAVVCLTPASLVQVSNGRVVSIKR